MLAAVDAAIGGKTGLNHAGLKNMIGSFYQPAAVCVDVDTLATLDDRTFRSGMAESLKHGLITDASFLQWQLDQAEAIASRTPGVLEKLIKQ